MIASMAEADGPGAQILPGSEVCSRAVQMQDGLSRWTAQDFDFTPANRADAAYKGFGDSFFGSKACCQRSRIIAYLCQLPLGVDAFEKALPVAQDGTLQTLDFNQVDTCIQSRHSWMG